MEVDSSELLKRLILAGLGISFLPRINVIDELNQGRLQTIDIKDVNIPRDLGLISRHDMPLTRAGNTFFTFATGSVRPSPHSETAD
jgi:DNA-binding transcriptional LysR family regulator